MIRLSCLRNCSRVDFRSLNNLNKPLLLRLKSTNTANHENIYTIPNALTTSRIFSCLPLGYSICSHDYKLATGILVYAGITDLVITYFTVKSNLN